MVDTAAIRGQLRQQRAQIATAQQQVQAQQLAQQTQRELRRQTKLGGVRRRQKMRTFQEAKSAKLAQIAKQKAAFEKKAQAVETKVAAVEAARAQAAKWEAARSLVRRRGAAAEFIAKGSNISTEVKQLLAAQGIGGQGEASFLAQRAGGIRGLGQRTVAEAQEAAKLAEATRSFSQITGEEITPARELKAIREFSRVQQKIQRGEKLTPQETRGLERAGVITRLEAQEETRTVPFEESQLSRDAGLAGGPGDMFRTSRVIEKPPVTRFSRKQISGITGAVIESVGRRPLPSPDATIFVERETPIERIAGGFRKARTKTRELQKEITEGIIGLGPAVGEAGTAFTGLVTKPLIPEEGVFAERGQILQFQPELPGEPAGLPEAVATRTSPILTREGVARAGGQLGTLGFAFLPGGAEILAASAGAGALRTLRTPIQEAKILTAGKRPEGITDAEWNRFKLEVKIYNQQQREFVKAQKQAKKRAGIELGVSGAILGLGAARVGRKVFVEPIDVRRIKSKPITEKIDRQVLLGEQGAIVKTQLRTIVPPDQLAFTTRFRKILRLQEKIKPIGRQREFITTAEVLAGKKDAFGFFLEKEVGKRQQVFGTIAGTGKGVKLTKEGFSKLPKYQQYIYKNLAESITGSSVPMSQVPNILGQTGISKASFRQQALFKIGSKYSYVPKKGIVLDVGGKRIKVLDPKKSTKFFEGVAKTEPGRTITIAEKGVARTRRLTPEEAERLVFDFIGVKEVTPGKIPRAAGKVSKISGPTFIESREFPGFEFFIPSKGKVEPASGIFDLAQIGKPVKTTGPLTQVQKEVVERAAALKPVVKPSRIPAPVGFGETPTALKLSTEGLPRMVGGTGLFNLTQPTAPSSAGVQIPIIRTIPITRPIGLSDVSLVNGVDSAIKPLTGRAIKPISTPTTFMQKTPTTSLRVGISPALRAQVKPAIKQVVTTRTIPRVTPGIPSPQIPRPPKTPTPSGFFRRPPTRPPRTRITPRPRPTPQAFAVDVRRRGKFFQVATGVTQKAAVALGVTGTTKAAAATFRIRKVKGPARKVKAPRITPEQLVRFRRGAKPGEFVEKRKLRIITPGEKREISFVGASARRRAPSPMFAPVTKTGRKKKKTTKKRKTTTKSRKRKKK